MIRAGLRIQSGKSRMDKLRRISSLLICGFVMSVVVKECVGVPGIYLISPPTAPTASPRSDSGGMETSESLWIGSHKINWSPLPLFLKFTNPSAYQEQKQQAEARKFEPKTPIIVAKKAMFNGFETDWNHRQQHARHYTTHYTTKYPLRVGRFPDFPPRPQLPQPYLDGARSISTYNQHLEKNDEYEIITGTSQRQSQVTTPAPMYVSTSATLLVSPPQAVASLGTPGPNISPIVDKLRRMTEWSKQHTNSFSKKEGRPTPVYPFQERKLRVRKRLIIDNNNNNDNVDINGEVNAEVNRNGNSNVNSNGNSNVNNNGNSNDNSNNGNDKPVKKYKHNIAEIIADDNEDNSPVTPPTNDRSNILKYKKDTSKINKNKAKVEYSYEDDFRPSSPATSSQLVIVHPTNAAFLIKDHREALHLSKKDHLVRKEKNLGFFKKEGSFKKAAAVSFRFGPEDARVSPYSYRY